MPLFLFSQSNSCIYRWKRASLKQAQMIAALSKKMDWFMLPSSFLTRNSSQRSCQEEASLPTVVSSTLRLLRCSAQSTIWSCSRGERTSMSSYVTTTIFDITQNAWETPWWVYCCYRAGFPCVSVPSRIIQRRRHPVWLDTQTSFTFGMFFFTSFCDANFGPDLAPYFSGPKIGS